MSDQASSPHSEIPSDKTRISRARSLPAARPFRTAVFITTIYFFGLIVTGTAFVGVIIHRSETAGKILLYGAIFSAVAWFVAFFKRRSALCPLCKGTPLLNSRAFTHTRAWRMWPCNHGTTAILSIMATQKFRCMYCGSDFDLLKPRNRILYGEHETAAMKTHDHTTED